VRIAVLHPQTAFTRGGAELHTESLVRALRESGHEAEQVTIAGKWYPATELAHQMAVWRSFDISESNGLKVDAVIALKFPAYLAPHERKIVWLIHQHRSAYELWDHPDFADLSRQEEGPTIRPLVWNSDRLGLGEAKRIFTNSRNVADRLWGTLRLKGDVLYHRSPATEALLARDPEELGDYLFYPSRLEILKRQSLAIDAMRHVATPVKLVLVGRGPDERSLREWIRSHGLEEQVRLEVGVSNDRLHELYRGSLGVFFGPFDEDYGYVTIEAFAAARPVVTLTDSGGPLEFVRNAETGLVTSPAPKAIAGAFDRLWSDREAARTWGVAGHGLVRETVPDWSEVVARLLG
jgi:glycosyltransferase involved in cell wall biosynthesis